jgi:hypothetical protein
MIGRMPKRLIRWPVTKPRREHADDMPLQHEGRVRERHAALLHRQRRGAISRFITP